MTTGEIVAAVIGPVSFALFLYFFNRIQNRKPRVVEVPVEVPVHVRVPVVVVGTTDIPLPLTLQEADVMPATGANKINLDITKCPRCGNDHEDVEFDAFGDRPVAGYTHYGKCPDTDEPILVRVGVTDDGEVAAAAASVPKTDKPASSCGTRCSS